MPPKQSTGISRDIKNALEILGYAGLIYQAYSTAASGLPLISLINEKKFKVLFLDIGLVTRTSHLNTELLLTEDILLVNRGMLAEQFVGQELLAYASPLEEAKLYFWCREVPSSMAEVDFVTNVDAKIIPIEVKAGTTGQLRSLRMLMQEKKLSLGIRISQKPLAFDGQILSLPIYMVGEMSRLIRQLSVKPDQLEK
jgi:predicted AAA+ superfamily ATPase